MAIIKQGIRTIETGSLPIDSLTILPEYCRWYYNDKTLENLGSYSHPFCEENEDKLFEALEWNNPDTDFANVEIYQLTDSSIDNPKTIEYIGEAVGLRKPPYPCWFVYFDNEIWLTSPAIIGIIEPKNELAFAYFHTEPSNGKKIRTILSRKLDPDYANSYNLANFMKEFERRTNTLLGAHDLSQ